MIQPGDELMDLFVSGRPAPQGNHRTNAAGFIYEQQGEQLKVWRDAVTYLARARWRGAPASGPMKVELSFAMPKPKKITRPMPTTRPDLDKLVRAVLDALTHARVWEDDSQVVELSASKLYADEPGVGIRLWQKVV